MARSFTKGVNPAMNMKNSGSVNSMGRHPPNMETLFSFMSLDISRCRRCGSFSYFFCSLFICGWITCILADDLRDLISPKTVMALMRIVEMTTVSAMLSPVMFSNSQRIPRKSHCVRKKSLCKLFPPLVLRSGAPRQGTGS